MTAQNDEALDQLFAALADPIRRALLMRLVRSGPASATRLAEDHEVTRQAIVKHLQAMEAAGLVAGERRGREVVFTATVERLGAALQWLFDAGARWERSERRLRSRTSG